MEILPAVANHKIPAPSKINKTANNNDFPLKPYFFPTLSATNPPNGRANKLIHPKIPAAIPATARLAPNVSVKKIGAKLSTVISTPKHAAYEIVKIQVR